MFNKIFCDFYTDTLYSVGLFNFAKEMGFNCADIPISLENFQEFLTDESKKDYSQLFDRFMNEYFLKYKNFKEVEENKTFFSARDRKKATIFRLHKIGTVFNKIIQDYNKLESKEESFNSFVERNKEFFSKSSSFNSLICPAFMKGRNSEKPGMLNNHSLSESNAKLDDFTVLDTIILISGFNLVITLNYEQGVYNFLPLPRKIDIYSYIALVNEVAENFVKNRKDEPAEKVMVYADIDGIDFYSLFYEKLLKHIIEEESLEEEPSFSDFEEKIWGFLKVQLVYNGKGYSFKNYSIMNFNFPKVDKIDENYLENIQTIFKYVRISSSFLRKNYLNFTELFVNIDINSMCKLIHMTVPRLISEGKNYFPDQKVVEAFMAIDNKNPLIELYKNEGITRVAKALRQHFVYAFSQSESNKRVKFKPGYKLRSDLSEVKSEDQLLSFLSEFIYFNNYKGKTEYAELVKVNPEAYSPVILNEDDFLGVIETIDKFGFNNVKNALLGLGNTTEKKIEIKEEELKNEEC